MIYVDEFRLWLPRQPRPFHEGSSHLTSDVSLDELHEFARRLGLKKSWFQPRCSLHKWVATGDRGIDLSSHYDLTRSRRERALAMSAVFMPIREQIRRRASSLAAPVAGAKEGGR